MEEDFAAVQRIDTVPVTAAPNATRQAQQPAKNLAAPSKLEPFLLLAKSARGAGAAALIDQATAAQGVFCYNELLETKAISEVSIVYLQHHSADEIDW